VLHDMACPTPGVEHEDAAKRISDTYRLHRLADHFGSIGKWFASRLSDGTSDGVLYDLKVECISHQHHNEKFFAFVRVGPHDMNVCESQTFLNVQRRLSEKGIGVIDPDQRGGGPVMIPRLTREDMRAQMSSILRGTPPSNIILPRKGS
jgi:hypothetical protein